MIIKLEQSAVIAVPGPIREKSDHITLRYSRHLFDGNLSPGKFRPHRCGERRGIMKVGLHMKPKLGMPVFRRPALSVQQENQADYGERPHCDLIKGLTGFATFAV